MIFLMAVPAAIEAAVSGGTAYVNGAVVKDAITHQVISHLQPTSLLSQAVSLGTAGPLAPAQLITELGSSAQLMKLEQMLSTVQTVASIGAASSVLNLGISVGGFALVLRALKRVQSTLNGVASTVQRIERMLEADFFSGLDIELRRAEETFEVAEDRRIERWEATEHALDRQIGVLLWRLNDLKVPLESGAPFAPGMYPLLADPVVSSLVSLVFELQGARTEALLCLRRPMHAVRLLRRAEGWWASLPTDAKAVALARARGRALSSSQIDSVAAQARAVTAWAARGREVTQERAELCESMQQLGVDTHDYVLKVRFEPGVKLLMLPHSPEAVASLPTE
jgi:hypothetical protein